MPDILLLLGFLHILISSMQCRLGMLLRATTLLEKADDNGKSNLICL